MKLQECVCLRARARARVSVCLYAALVLLICYISFRRTLVMFTLMTMAGTTIT